MPTQSPLHRNRANAPICVPLLRRATRPAFPLPAFFSSPVALAHAARAPYGSRHSTSLPCTRALSSAIAHSSFRTAPRVPVLVRWRTLYLCRTSDCIENSFLVWYRAVLPSVAHSTLALRALPDSSAETPSPPPFSLDPSPQPPVRALTFSGTSRARVTTAAVVHEHL